MILHIFQNTSFITQTQFEFNKCTDDSRYLILEDVKDLTPPLFHLNEADAIQHINTTDYRLIVVHNLNADKAKIILKSNYTKDIHWSSWGNDIYNTTFGINPLSVYDQQTIDFLASENIETPPKFHHLLPEFVFTIIYFLYFLIKKEHHPTYWVKKLLREVTTFSSVIPTEKEIIKRKLPKAVFRDFCYVNTKTITPETINDFEPKSLGPQILVGNSATMANNHISVFEKLKHHALAIPFSYGHDAYQTAILKNYGADSLKTFLTEHLSYDDYVLFLAKNNTLIINTYRQQALVNIVLALKLGMRVYFNTKNPTFHFLKDLGVEVFDFWKDFDTYTNQAMSANQILNNRKCIEKYWGDKASNTRMKAF